MNGKTKISCALPSLAILLAGCGAQQYEFDPELHISQERVTQDEPVDASGVPDLVGSTAALPELAYEGQSDLFDVSVENVSVRTVLLSLADQAQLNMDIDPTLDGPISLNAYGQTLAEIMERISRQLPIRFERIGETLVVLRDEYYTKQYYLHYPDLTRTYTASFDGDAGSTGSASVGSSTITSNKDASGSVWVDIEEAIRVVIENLQYQYPDTGTAPLGTDAETQEESEIVNQLVTRKPTASSNAFVHTLPDAGLIIVFGNTEHHQIASDIIEQVSTSSRRQVLLQATVVEILLNNQYQQGIDWSLFNGANDSPTLISSATESYGRVLQGPGLEAANQYREFVSSFTTDEMEINNLVSDFVLNAKRAFPPASTDGGFINATFTVGDLDVAVALLDQFGDTRVVSSPRISTLNGQGAILKVVTDEIYFSQQYTRERDEAGVVTETFEVEEETVPVGFVVNVYPQIGNDGSIILAMRPSVSRVIGTAEQPTVGTRSSVINTGVPILNVKEIETLMMINDGQTAVMGGLIEDQLLDVNSSVPGAASLPGVGDLFKRKNETTRRVEYVIFVSAKIVNNPSIYGDYSEYRDLLPSGDTFRRDQTGSFFSRPALGVPRGE